jgi:hypothetical protein
VGRSVYYSLKKENSVWLWCIINWFGRCQKESYAAKKNIR